MIANINSRPASSPGGNSPGADGSRAGGLSSETPVACSLGDRPHGRGSPIPRVAASAAPRPCSPNVVARGRDHGGEVTSRLAPVPNTRAGSSSALSSTGGLSPSLVRPCSVSGFSQRDIAEGREIAAGILLNHQHYDDDDITAAAEWIEAFEPPMMERAWLVRETAKQWLGATRVPR